MVRPASENQLKLLYGLAAIAAIFIIQAAVGAVMTAAAGRRAERLIDQSVASLVFTFQIARAVDQTHLLVDEHIVAGDGGRAAARKRRIAELAVDIDAAEEGYQPLIGSAAEARVWQEVLELLDRFGAYVDRAVARSHDYPSPAARASMAETAATHEALQQQLTELIEINERQATAALRRAHRLQKTTEIAQWVARITALLGLLLVGRWAFREFTAYEERIVGYLQELEAKNRDLDAFAGRVAHDVKNALSPLSMSSSLLRRSAEDPQRVLAIAERTERSSQRAATLVDSLLAFARAGTTAHDERAALRPAFERVRDELGPGVAQLEAELVLEEVPDLEVRCDPGLLHVALTNICGNAVKFLEGREVRRVVVSAREDSGSCRIDVEDTGPGIPAAAQERIFEPFFRVEGITAGGTGIGLATVRRIVDARGGRLTVASTEGRGSRFSLWLPLATLETRALGPDVPRSGSIARTKRRRRVA